MVLVQKEVKAVYLGSTKVRPAENPERIEYKMNANNNGYLYVPIAGVGTNGSTGVAYDWNISIDGDTPTNYTGTSSSNGDISLSGYTAGSNHTITITPTTEDYGWARAYGWSGTAGRSYITEVVYDSSYMGYAVSATNTGEFFRYNTYSYCKNMTKGAEEYLPDTVTTIGGYFRGSEYEGCRGLLAAEAESLPSSVTSIGGYFRSSQYMSCKAINEIKGWKDLSIGNSSGWRSMQFYDCTTSKTVTVLSDVGFNPGSGNYALQNSYISTVYVPSAYLSNYTSTNNYPRNEITDSKFVGY